MITPDERVIKSYVWHDNKCYFVSTINRDSSAPYGGRYAETLVWEYDWDGRERGDLVGQTGGCEGTIVAHQWMCMLIFKTGRCEEERGDE